MKLNVYTERCPICGRTMMYKSKGRVFSQFGDSDIQKRLISEQGVVFISSSKKDDEFICEVCESEGKASFTCALCEKTFHTDNIQQSFGDPAEYLCKVCYTTIPANVWEKKVDDLEKAHRWDFE